MAQHTGGHPLFVLETVRHLIETRQLEGGLPEHWPLPEKVRQVEGRRLALRSAPALQAARAAAVLQRDVDPELVARVLNAPVLDIAVAWAELEGAHVMHGDAFSHDIVAEVVAAQLPVSAATVLHRSAARSLERQGASAARRCSRGPAAGPGSGRQSPGGPGHGRVPGSPAERPRRRARVA